MTTGNMSNIEGMGYLESPMRKALTVYLPLLAFVFVLLFPFYWMGITSFKPNNELLSREGNPFWVQSPTFAHFYKLLFETSYPQWMWNTLLISVMRRTREIGLLRAVGMTTGQVGTMILVESLFMALVGAILGCALGLSGAKWPLALHVEQVSGYFLPLYVPWTTIAIAFGASLLIGVVASVLPSRRAARLDVLEAITYE